MKKVLVVVFKLVPEKLGLLGELHNMKQNLKPMGNPMTRI